MCRRLSPCESANYSFGSRFALFLCRIACCMNGSLNWHTSCLGYAHLVKLLLTLAEGRLLVVYEGRYDLRDLIIDYFNLFFHCSDNVEELPQQIEGCFRALVGMVD